MTHPYTEYENTTLWNAIEDALNKLKLNGDIEITTNEKYVVGFLCKSLKDAEIVTESKPLH